MTIITNNNNNIIKNNTVKPPTYPLAASPPYCGGEVCDCLFDPESYVGWSLVLLAGPPMPDMSKGRGQMKSSLWCSSFGVEW